MNDLDAFFYKDTSNSEEKGVFVFISAMEFLWYGSATGDSSQKATSRKGGDE